MVEKILSPNWGAISCQDFGKPDAVLKGNVESSESPKEGIAIRMIHVLLDDLKI